MDALKRDTRRAGGIRARVRRGQNVSQTERDYLAEYDADTEVNRAKRKKVARAMGDVFNRPSRYTQSAYTAGRSPVERAEVHSMVRRRIDAAKEAKAERERDATEWIQQVKARKAGQ